MKPLAHVPSGGQHDRTAVFAAELYRKPHNRSELLEKEDDAVEVGITLTAGVENLVTHGLGRAFRGWYLADKQGAGDVWRVATSTEDSAHYLPLACSADITVTLVVF